MDMKRWSEQLPPEARKVLEAGRKVHAPAGARHAVWSALASELPASASTAAATRSGPSVLAMLKPFGVGLAIGGLAATGIFSALNQTHTASPPLPVTSAGQAAQPVTSPSAARELSAPDLTPLPTSSAAPARSAPRSGGPSGSAESSEPVTRGPSIATFPTDSPSLPAPESAVLLESRAVARARTMLQQGNARGVLSELGAIDRNYPRGVLLQERAALRIEALLAVGDRARARDEAERFLALHPDSPHAPAVQQALRASSSN